MVNIGNDWDELLKDEWGKPYYLALREFLKAEYGSGVVHPDMHDIFNALRYTSYEGAKIVLLGQDPYHGDGQAHGLCFSVKRGVQKPPSLQNMFKELGAELSVPAPEHGELTEWAKQGVLLLNTCLTVRHGMANSHSGKGWEILTDRIIQLLNERERPLIFFLWGGSAKQKARLIDGSRHVVLTAAHPSPLSAYNGFFGCGHFKTANEILESWGESAIRW
jgi:uracil-DNA glycosylase